MDNETRKSRANAALLTYQEWHGFDNDTDDAVDLLADLFHLISSWDEDPKQLVETAMMHWEAEK